MLPIARKPIVQYVAEELIGNGIDQILFITGRNKTSIENHFDTDPDLQRQLIAQKKPDLLREIDLESYRAHFFYTRQRVQRGLGDAVLCGETFAGTNPFLVALGDSIIGLHGESRAVERMIALFELHNAAAVIAVEEVAPDETQHYGIVNVMAGGGDSLRVTNLVEKPKPEAAPSNLAIAGRYAFSPKIFDMVRQVGPDMHGEIQLTDAIRMLCESGETVLALKLPPNEKRYDIGNFSSYFETFVEFALADPLYGEEFRGKLERMLEKDASAAKV